MKFRLALLVGLLLVTSITAQFSSTDAPTSVTTTEAPTTTNGSPDGSTTPGSATSNGTPASPASTVSSGPSDSPGTTVSSGTDLPSSGAPSTQGGSTGSTVSQGPTTTAPLPNVTYSLLQFATPVCVDLTCTYEFNAPGNNQKMLATDQSIITGDRTQFNTLQTSANNVDASVKAANDAAKAKIADLQALFDQIQLNLNYIQNATATIQNQQNQAASTLIYVEQFISGVNGDTGSCLYQRCLKPTTPAPPTTPTTPAPTTPPSPCLNFTCPDDPLGVAHCKLDTSNQPACDNCLGNYNGYTHCDTVACSATATPFVLDPNGNGTWLSAGYNTTNSSLSVIPANSNCVYNLPAGVTFTVSTSPNPLNLACLQDQTATIRFTSSDGSFYQEIAATTSVRSLNSLLSKVPGGTITLTSKSNTVSSFCLIPLTTLSKTSSEWIEIQGLEEKKNGFFSWFMGY